MKNHECHHDHLPTDPPLVHGGQGRSADDVTAAARWCFWLGCLLFCVAVLWLCAGGA